MSNVVLDAWEERVRQDLDGFADPGTSIDIQHVGSALEVHWVCEDKERFFRLRASSEYGNATVEEGGRRISYRSYLASDQVADLRRVARMIQRVYAPDTFSVPTFMKVKGSADWKPIGEEMDRLVGEGFASSGRTRLLFMAGDAGAGKTHSLQMLTHGQAERYLQRRADYLYFYVDAQGRALARFNEAVATELQDLRVRLTYHSLACLVRIGLIVPIVDGFDELLGTGGYDDAFDSLTDFLGDLAGQGVLVASARSVFYEDEFAARAQRNTARNEAWYHDALQLRPWTKGDVESYVFGISDGMEANKVTKLSQEVISVFESSVNRHLMTRPLFVARTVDVLMKGGELSGEDLLDDIIDHYLERERTEKMLGVDGRPLLDTQGPLRRFYETVALEMWHQKTRELDGRTIKELVEIELYDLDLPSKALSVLKERSNTLPMLSTGGNRRSSIQFEHELFFAFFMAGGFAQALVDRASLHHARIILGRSLLSTEVARRAAQHFARREHTLSDWLDLLGDVSNAEGTGLVRQNAGRLAIALMTHFGGQVADARLAHLSFFDTDFRGLAFVDCSLEDCHIRGGSLAGTTFDNCVGRSCLLEGVLVDRDSTRLDIEGLLANSVLSIRVVQDESRLIVRPNLVSAELARVGLPTAVGAERTRYDVSERAVDIVEQVVNLFRSTNLIAFTDQYAKPILQVAERAGVLPAMVEEGLLHYNDRSASGQKVFIKRSFVPQDVLAGLDRETRVDDKIHGFWERLEVAQLQS